MASWRALVGVGEATLPPTAVALLGDRFPPARLGFATSVFYSGIPVGFALSLAFSAAVAPRLGWRACFVLLGLRRIRGGDARLAHARPAAAKLPGGRSGRPPRRPRPRVRDRAAPQSVLARADAAGTHGGRSAPRLHERRVAARRQLAGERPRLSLRTRGLPRRGAPPRRPAPATSRSVRSRTGPAAAGRRPGSSSFVALGAVALAAHLRPATRSRRALRSSSRAGSSRRRGASAGTARSSPSCTRWRPPDSRATVIGSALLVVNLLGVATGPWVTGLIADRTSLTTGLVASLGAMAAGLFLVLLAAGRRSPSPLSAATGRERGPTRRRARFGRLPRRPPWQTERPRRQVREAVSRRERTAVSAEGLRPGRHAGHRLQGEGREVPRAGHRAPRRPAGQALRAGPLGGAARLPGDGRRRQGRRDQARDVGREPAGLPGLLVQGPDVGRPRPRLPLAHREVPARARAHRHLQPLVLRGGARRPRAPGDPRQAEAAGGPRDEADLEGAPRGHRRPRALPRSQRRRRREVLPARLEGGAEEALPRTARPAREELEVLVRRREGAAPLEGLHAGVRGDDPGDCGSARAVVRRARRQEVVLAHRRRRRHHPGDGEARPRATRRSTNSRRRSWRSRARSSGTRRGSPRRRRPPERPRPPPSQGPSARRRRSRARRRADGSGLPRSGPRRAACPFPSPVEPVELVEPDPTADPTAANDVRDDT